MKNGLMFFGLLTGLVIGGTLGLIMTSDIELTFGMIIEILNSSPVKYTALFVAVALGFIGIVNKGALIVAVIMFAILSLASLYQWLYML